MAVKARRITVFYNLPHENAEIFTSSGEQEKLDIPNLFEDAQISFKTKDGLFTVPEYKIVLIDLWNLVKPIPKESIYVRRLTLEYELTFYGAYIIPPHKYHELGIPLIYEREDQLAFVADKSVYLTTDLAVVQVYYGKGKIVRK